MNYRIKNPRQSMANTRITLTLYGQRFRTHCSLSFYPKAAAYSSHLALSTLIPDTRYQKERYHQEKSNVLLMPLARKEGAGTHSIRSWERLGGLLKFYDHEAA